MGVRFVWITTSCFKSNSNVHESRVAERKLNVIMFWISSLKIKLYNSFLTFVAVVLRLCSFILLLARNGCGKTILLPLIMKALNKCNYSRQYVSACRFRQTQVVSNHYPWLHLPTFPCLFCAHLGVLEFYCTLRVAVAHLIKDNLILLVRIRLLFCFVHLGI